MAQGVPSHITFLYPWRPAPLVQADIDSTVEAARGIAVFEVTLRRLYRFSGVLVLRPEPDDELRALITRLTLAFPETPPCSGAVADPVPHVTIARAPSEKELDQRAVSRVITIREIALDEEGPGGIWRTCYPIPLAAQT